MLWLFLIAGAIFACVNFMQSPPPPPPGPRGKQLFIRYFQHLLQSEFPNHRASVTEAACGRYMHWLKSRQAKSKLAPHVTFFRKQIKPSSRSMVASIYATDVAPLFAPHLAAEAAHTPELFFDKITFAHHAARKLAGL